MSASNNKLSDHAPVALTTIRAGNVHDPVLQAVDDPTPDHPPAVNCQFVHPGVIDDQRSVLGCGLGILKRQAGVVSDTLWVANTSFQWITETRQLRPDLFRGEVDMLVVTLGIGEVVEDGQSGSDLEQTLAPKHRKYERNRVNQVGSDLEEDGSLSCRLSDQQEVSILEVANTAVDDLRGAT